MSISKMQSVRIGLDFGTNSLGWCVLGLNNDGNPDRILAMGSSIFSDGRDPKSKASLALDRRAARAMRRRRDRFQQRQRALMKYLAADGLFPVDRAEREALRDLDPFALRARGLDEKLPLHHIGRAFWHLNKRRGFQSNRKTDRKNSNEAGKVDIGIDRLNQAIIEAGARTFGEFLHLRRQKTEDVGSGHLAVPSVRTRLRPEEGPDAKGDGYDFYPGRALLKKEFDAIFEAQAEHHPDVMTQEVHDRLFEIVFHQRPLKQPKIGTCTLVGGEPRLAKAHPLFQRRRLIEEVNALAIVMPGETARTLTLDERDRLVLKLKDSRKIAFKSLRKELKLPPEARFNKESENRTDLLGDEIAATMGDKKRFGARWSHFTVERQWEIISRLRDDEDTDALVAWLAVKQGLSDAEAEAVASAPLPEGFGRFGETATRALIAELEKDVVVYSEAVIRTGLGHHSDFRTGEVYVDSKGRSALPYYGVALERHIMPGTGDKDDPDELRVGRLTNPTVHIGLNRLRIIVNELIKTYGMPKEIAIELARELKQTEEEKKEADRRNNKNRIAAERRSQKLRDIGEPDTGANRALLRLWEELDADNVLSRRCVYSGKQISCDMLFDGSVEIDHILPLSQSLDDSNGNKVLCLREANRRKRQRTPFAAFGGSDDWAGIAERAALLPREKRWRFEPDALQHFDKIGGFQARQLVDTQYLGRRAAEYLSVLYPGKGEDSSHVWVSPGRMTELVRRKLGLNSLLPDHNIGGGADQPKNRLDHRHHALDAFVIAIVDRRLLQLIARESGLTGAEGRERLIVPDPWEGFRDALKEAVDAITVYHRPDHGSAKKTDASRRRDQTAGRLHNDTAYGFTGESAGRNPIVVHRVPLTALKPTDLEPGAVKGVRETALREALRLFTQGLSGKDFDAAVRRFSTHGPLPFRGIRRVRVVEPLAVIAIRDAEGRAYKAYKGDSNHRCDVWEMPDGKWLPEVVSTYQAHQPGWISTVRTACPTARKVLSLHINDVLAIEEEGVRRLMRVVFLSQNGQVTLAELQEGGNLKERDRLPREEDPFKYFAPTAGGLKARKARQVRVDALGRVFDPGFPARTARRRTRPKA